MLGFVKYLFSTTALAQIAAESPEDCAVVFVGERKRPTEAGVRLTKTRFRLRTCNVELDLLLKITIQLLDSSLVLRIQNRIFLEF